MPVDEYILEDDAGGLYILDPCAGRLEPLDPPDANQLIQWFELSQSFSWHTVSDLVNTLLHATPPAPRRTFSAPATLASRQLREEVPSPVSSTACWLDDECLQSAFPSAALPVI
jgi:hypothetical protein